MTADCQKGLGLLHLWESHWKTGPLKIGLQQESYSVSSQQICIRGGEEM